MITIAANMNGALAIMIPSAETGIAPVHGMLFCTSSIGAALAIVSIATNLKGRKRAAVITASVFSVICAAYLLVWLLSLPAV